MPHILPHGQQINAFLEDTCVLITLAYLLSRGSLLPRLFDRHRTRREQIALALFFGLIGGSDLLFPGDRLPYVPSTLAACFAGYAGGLGLGLLTAVFMLALFVGAALTHIAHLHLLLLSGATLTATIIGAGTGWLRQTERSRETTAITAPKTVVRLVAWAFVAGTLAEVAHALWRDGLGVSATSPVLISAGANGFGCGMLTFVLHDAYERRQAARRHLQSEREIAALRLSQLSQLQARLHPHFLFNTLAAIAGLCLLSPAKAEQAITDLASLLRRFLHAPMEKNIPLREEMATVRTYLSIEALRLGDRLCVTEEVPEELLSCPVPRFCLQIPVENAVQHGISLTPRPGQIRIVARRHSPDHLLLAVIDNGLGCPPITFPRPGAPPPDAPLHGLTLLSIRLGLAEPVPGRLRLNSRPGQGTLCALRLPLGGNL